MYRFGKGLDCGALIAQAQGKMVGWTLLAPIPP
jgi:hypothetical protein